MCTSICALSSQDTSSRFGANQYLLILLNAARRNSKYQLYSQWFDLSRARTHRLLHLRWKHIITLHTVQGFLTAKGQVWKKKAFVTRYDYNLTIMKSPKPATDTIYPHIKFWWYRTMWNFYPPFLCLVLAAILKIADILKILKTQNCSSNGDLLLCQNLCLYHYPVRS